MYPFYNKALIYLPSSADTSQLAEVSLTSASVSSGPPNPPAPWVEFCSCPPGFAGHFCERCAPGFTREDPSRGPLSTCVPCICHGHGTCHPETGERRDLVSPCFEMIFVYACWLWWYFTESYCQCLGFSDTDKPDHESSAHYFIFEENLHQLYMPKSIYYSQGVGHMLWTWECVLWLCRRFVGFLKISDITYSKHIRAESLCAKSLPHTYLTIWYTIYHIVNIWQYIVRYELFDHVCVSEKSVQVYRMRWEIPQWKK